MRVFKFKGFPEDEPSYYGEGVFTVGQEYYANHVDGDCEIPVLKAIDDRGYPMWEELRGFDEVTK